MISRFPSQSSSQIDTPIPLTVALCNPPDGIACRYDGDVQVKGTAASHRQTIPVRCQDDSRKKPSTDQFLHRLKGAARQDAFGPCLGDVLQAEHITARSLVDVNCPDRNRLLSQPGGLCAGRLRPLPAVVRFVTAEGVVDNGGPDGSTSVFLSNAIIYSSFYRRR
jgi:hypothetical protein